MRRGGPIGPLATLTGEPGQARKGAAVVRDTCAEVWLVGPSLFPFGVFLIPCIVGASIWN